MRLPTAIGALFLLFVNLSDNLLPLLQKLCIDILLEPGHNWTLSECALAYLALISFQAIARYLYRHFLGQSNSGVAEYLRFTFTSHLFLSPTAFFASRKTGDLVNRASSDVDTIGQSFEGGVIVLFDALTYLLVIPIIMLYFSPKLTLISLSPFVVVPVIVRLFDGLIGDRFKRTQEVQGQLTTLAQEAVLGSRVIKTLAAESSFENRYRQIGLEFVERSLQLAKADSLLGPCLEVSSVLSLLLLLAFGGFEVQAGTVSIGTLVAFQRYIQRLLWPVQAIGVGIGMYQRAIASSERINEFISAPSEKSGTKIGKPAPGELAVEFQNVTFSFPGQLQPALLDVSFKLEQGQRLAVLGDNASGKSALLALIPQLYVPQSGNISIFSIQQTDWDLRELREAVSYVSQEGLILSTSIADNIALGSEKELNADSLVRAAARQAALEQEIALFSAGYETLLGERGITLSGGQRQRLCIARALRRKSAILLLDDVFSSVDSNTEKQIAENIWRSNCTVILTSHRLSTIKSAHKIIVLDKGRIIQSGTHDELIRDKNSWYHKFYHQQAMIEDLEVYAHSH